ncbi:MAG: hypothetical protein M1814_001401 [Vezdaea aestivalis]|nr:MAG: hypothetical protein M1814_001401 [Vezdaea aestivalis]
MFSTSPLRPHSIFFVGAPTSASVVESGKPLIHDLLPAFQTPNANHKSQYGSTNATPHKTISPEVSQIDVKTTKGRALNWIELAPQLSAPIERKESFSSLVENDGEEGDASFFSISSISFSEEVDDYDEMPLGSSIGDKASLTNFYDHSVLLEETTMSSQIELGADPQSRNEEGFNDSSVMDSFMSTVSRDLSFGPSQIKELNLLADLGRIGPVADLKSIPKASHIQGIMPQTMTVNIIAGIISINKPKQIRTRLGFDTELTEILVGDSTRAGFSISFWFPSHRSLSARKAKLKESLQGLRPRDVVLLRNVALGEFRKQVFGQSCRDLTSVDLLHRDPVDDCDEVGILRPRLVNELAAEVSWVRKAARVIHWIFEFAGQPTKPSAKGNELPPDTQDILWS